MRAEHVLLVDGERAARTALEDTRSAQLRAEARLTQLERGERERDAASADIRRRSERLERVLSTQFGRLARANMLLVSSADDRLSVALAIPALFSAGRTQVTANGRALLCELAQTVMQHHDGQLRVSGYHGKSVISEPALARYGTPWQLSAARAASAAAVLERDCELATERLYAVGYGPRAPGPLGENVAIELILSPRD
jgi:chemotaxis protein MotB